MTQNCVKFKLTEEEKYFLSGKDGSLYMDDLEIFKDNDLYCIDYTKSEENNSKLEVKKI